MSDQLAHTRTGAQIAQTLDFDTSILAGQLADSTLRTYERDFRAYLDYAGDHTAALSPVTLARWRAHLANETDKSPRTINRMLSAVKRMVGEAADQGYTDQDTAGAFSSVSGVSVKAMRDRTKANARTRITPAEMRQLCDAPNTETLKGTRDAALLATFASSGCRLSEIATLTTEQITERDDGYMLRVIGKNDTEPRDAPLSCEAHDLIQAWLERRPVESEYIFTSFAGRGARGTPSPLSSVSVWRIVRRYATSVGLADVKPHDFRRFVGTQLAKKDIRLAQKALGHERIDTTMRHYVLDELAAGTTDDLY